MPEQLLQIEMRIDQLIYLPGNLEGFERVTMEASPKYSLAYLR